MTSKQGRTRSSVGPALLALVTEWSALPRVLLSSGEQDEAALGSTILGVSGYVWPDGMKKGAPGALVSHSQREVRRRNFAGGRGALRHEQPGKSAFLGEVSKTRDTTAVATGIGRRGLHAGADHESHVADLCDAHFGSGFLERYKHNSVVLCGHFSSGRNATAWLQCSGPHLNVTGNKIEKLGMGAYCWGRNLTFVKVPAARSQPGDGDGQPTDEDWSWALEADCEWQVDEASDLVLLNRFAAKETAVRIPKKIIGEVSPPHYAAENAPVQENLSGAPVQENVNASGAPVQENLFVLNYFDDIWNPYEGMPQALAVHITQLLAREQLQPLGADAQQQHGHGHESTNLYTQTQSNHEDEPLPEGSILVLQKKFGSRSEGVSKLPYLYRQMLGGNNYIRADTPPEYQTGRAADHREVEEHRQQQARFTGKNVFFVVGSEGEEAFGLDCRFLKEKYPGLPECQSGSSTLDAVTQNKTGEFRRFSSCRGRAPLIESASRRILQVLHKRGHEAEGTTATSTTANGGVGTAGSQTTRGGKCNVLFYNRHDHRRRATNHEEARQALQAEENALALDDGQRASPRGLDACMVEDFDPDVLSVEEQVEALADARLMIGPHGATFALGALLMKPDSCSVAVEIFEEEFKGAHNIALLRNVTHINYVPSWGPAWGDSEFVYNVPELQNEYKKWRGMVRSC
ncbi:unnamed protein product [Amoebophrya sp. A120]|nr:unnamed protein product [Amoebophrya sp. A120]|eukprot:GSA120T00008878001.1